MESVNWLSRSDCKPGSNHPSCSDAWGSAQPPNEKQTHLLCAAGADNEMVFAEGFPNGLVSNGRKRAGDIPWWACSGLAAAAPGISRTCKPTARLLLQVQIPVSAACLVSPHERTAHSSSPKPLFFLGSVSRLMIMPPFLQWGQGQFWGSRLPQPLAPITFPPARSVLPFVTLHPQGWLDEPGYCFLLQSYFLPGHRVFKNPAVQDTHKVVCPKDGIHSPPQSSGR